MKARDRILARVRRALAGLPEAALPEGPVAPTAPPEEIFARFAARLEAAGARVERLPDPDAARAFLAEAEKGARAAWTSPLVPAPLRPSLSEAPPEEADLGVSRALAGVAETGSLLLTSREGRRGQLLVPRHLVWLAARDLVLTLLEALERGQAEDAAALALHSGPSKSADIGQIMVRGVHGPGELWVGVLAYEVAGWEESAGVRAGLSRLAGRVLLTKRGEPFLVESVGERAVRVRTRGGKGALLEIPVAYLERAARLARAGEDLSGPSRLRQKVGDRAPAYAWAILRELGYVRA